MFSLLFYSQHFASLPNVLYFVGGQSVANRIGRQLKLINGNLKSALSTYNSLEEKCPELPAELQFESMESDIQPVMSPLQSP
jgi:cell shape-determining protein MreC